MTDATRVFGGDQVTKIMDSFRLSDDIPIENKQVRRRREKGKDRERRREERGGADKGVLVVTWHLMPTVC